MTIQKHLETLVGCIMSPQDKDDELSSYEYFTQFVSDIDNLVVSRTINRGRTIFELTSKEYSIKSMISLS